MSWFAFFVAIVVFLLMAWIFFFILMGGYEEWYSFLERRREYKRKRGKH